MFFKKQKQFNKGQAVILSVIFFLIISIILVFGIVTPVTRGAKIVRDVQHSRSGYFIAEAGIEDVAYRIQKGKNVSLIEYLSLGGNYATTTVTNLSLKRILLESEGNANDRIRKINSHLFLTTTQADFNFGVQTDEGGFIMENNSGVIGNLYSNGPIYGSGNGKITGSAVSAGPVGLADGIEVTGDMYAHDIVDADIGQDAYYTSISGSSVGGTSFPGSPDQATTSLPFTDVDVDSWKLEAEAGGVYSGPCPYEIIDTDTTLGPIKIECDLIISGDPTITLEGVVWVEGDVDLSNNTIVELSPLLDDGLSTGMIADNETNRLTSSKIILTNSVIFSNGGITDGYVIMLSQNNSAENGGGEKAIDIGNTVGGDALLYAGHGEIVISNSVDVKQVTAYRIRLQNFTTITYESGLASLLFTTGPGGGWTIEDWEEI